MKRASLTLALLALLALGLAGCGNSAEAEEVLPDPGVAVEVETVSRRSISTENNISGLVVAEKNESIYVSVSARCTNVPVEEGDMVRAGDVICVLDLGTYQDNYELASMNYANAQQSYNDQTRLLADQIAQAEKNYHDTVALFEIGAASQFEVDNAKLTWDSALVSRTSALSQLELAMKNAEASMNQITDALGGVDLSGQVRAPISGVISSLSIAKNGFASAGMPLATVSSVDDRKISIAVSETLVSKLHIGDAATVTIGALGISFPSEIKDVSSTADQMTKLYNVNLTIPTEQTQILNGMFADVKLFTDSREDAIVIPTEAILISDEGNYVVTLDGAQLAQHVLVQTGLVGDGVTEILSGLSGGETLVVVGQSYLGEGDLARIVPAKE